MSEAASSTDNTPSNTIKNFFSNHPLAIGYIEITLAQFCVGINVVTGKQLIAYFPIFMLLTLRYFIGLSGIGLIAQYKRVPINSVYRNFMALAYKDKILVIFQALCGGFLFNALLLYGMKNTTAAAAGIISSITPMVIFILSAVLLQEKINSRKWVAIYITVAGLIILNIGERFTLDGSKLIGNLFILLAVIPAALFTVLSKLVGDKITQLEAVMLINFFNLILFAAFAGLTVSHINLNYLSLNIYILILLYTIPAGIIFFLLWYDGITKVSASTAALLTGFKPISTIALSFIFLHEYIHFNEIIGMVLIITAIFIGCNKEYGSILQRDKDYG